MTTPPLTEDALREAVRTFAHYFWNELGWEHFRAEMFASRDREYASASKNNAAIIMRALREIGDRHPELRELIDGEKP